MIAVRGDGFVQAFGPFDSYRQAEERLNEARSQYGDGWTYDIVRLRD